MTVIATFPAGNPRASIDADQRALDEQHAHPGAHVDYDPVHDDFVVVTHD